ncbi:hypothetical protein lerEdw1_015697 [Lerista edwardsae]|nr:hypothetical protein lerEdw1_015697 [Lerista edwardsae]
MPKQSRPAKMEAAMAALELNAQKLSGEKEEGLDGEKAKGLDGEKLKVLETTEAAKDRKTEILARAAEKVAGAQIAMVLKSAKAEGELEVKSEGLGGEIRGFMEIMDFDKGLGGRWRDSIMSEAQEKNRKFEAKRSHPD